ncbi:hypothetical protein [Roseitranquillus sediminis]|uniref:hypothetical protein n=1 Tax=Roseitranquillus sediminis TaxID=2809051 RepID=UPI001D0C951D|nr:hypothetical protein [Roseitranquillus sediminis]MBM9595811.1 hypothetical protein [Roseitranquillus sediminis]
MSAQSQTIWFALFVVTFSGLLFVWLWAGLLAVVVLAAASDLGLSVVEHRHKLAQSQTKVSDQ